MEAIQGLWFWSFINTAIAGGTLAYIVKTEHRLTAVETTLKMMLGNKKAAE